MPSIPAHHPDCCVAISDTLLDNICQLVPDHRTLLSIGSGTGYLESQLQARRPTITVRGVEVSSSVNKHLETSHVSVVGGTWDLYDGAQEADVWLFCYPREPRLVKEYMFHHARGSRPHCIIWLGPLADWSDYEGVFSSSSFSRLTRVSDCGAAAYEAMYLAKVDRDGDSL